MKNKIILAAVITASVNVSAGDLVGMDFKPTSVQIMNTRSQQVTHVPVYNVGAVSAGAYVSTSVSGGSTTDGSGNIIPTTTTKSTSNTVYGVGMKTDF